MDGWNFIFYLCSAQFSFIFPCIILCFAKPIPSFIQTRHKLTINTGQQHNKQDTSLYLHKDFLMKDYFKKLSTQDSTSRPASHDGHTATSTMGNPTHKTSRKLCAAFYPFGSDDACSGRLIKSFGSTPLTRCISDTSEMGRYNLLIG